MVSVIRMGPLIFKFHVQNRRLRIQRLSYSYQVCQRLPNFKRAVALDKFLLMFKIHNDAYEVILISVVKNRRSITFI